MGFAISHKFAVRVRFLQQYLQFISYIKTEIRYSQRVLSEIISKYIVTEVEFEHFLTSVKANLRSEASFADAWQKALCKIPSAYGLLKQERELICEFGNKLGVTDVDGQIALCELNKSLINSILNTAKDEKSKKSRLYFMLGSSFGICLAIILL